MFELESLPTWVLAVSVLMILSVFLLGMLLNAGEKQLVRTEVVRIRTCRTVWRLPEPPRRPEPPMQYGPFIPGITDYQQMQYYDQLRRHDREMSEFHIRQSCEMRHWKETGNPPGYPDHLELTFAAYPGQSFSAKLSTDCAAGQSWKVEFVYGKQSGRIYSWRFLERVESPAVSA